MEVISGASAVLQVVATSATLIAKTAVFIQNAKQVNETTNNLFNQVTTLQSTVQVVHTVLKGWQTNLGDGPLGHEEAEALAKMKTTLKATSGTIQWLETRIESLGGGKSEPKWLRKGWTQLKYQLQAPVIETAQRQIETSIVSLDLMLKCATRHEEIRTVNTGFHGTHEILASIHDKMDKLKTLMERSLPAASSNMSNDEEELTFEDELLDIDKIAGQTSSLAAECLTVAESVCDKISRSDSIPDFTTEITNAARSPGHDGGAGSSTGNAQRGLLGSDFDYPDEHTDMLSDSDSDEATEPLEVLTGHVDNNYRMALAAIKREDFDTAEDHILNAITNAEQRESTYRFPFEDRLRFTEIHAFVLTKQKRFVDATDKYKSLLRTAQGYEDKGRLYYSLALMHRDKYYLNHLGGEDDALFEGWKTNGVQAFKYAVKCHRVRRGSLDADEPWKACPSLNQAAELLCDMNVRWGKPAEAATYRQYLKRSEAAHSSTPPSHVTFPVHQGAPPTPPSSDAPIGGRRLSISSVGSDSELESLHRIKTAASKGIFATIGSNNYEATEFILTSADNTFHIDQTNEDGLTPLLLAVQNGHAKIVRLLLENDPKPDIKAKGKSGWTVLHYALWGPGRDVMLELLLRHGADVHASAKEGTPLHFAATHNNVTAAQRLISQNAALEAEDDAKRTPIMRAALEKKYEMVNLLLNKGAILDASQFDSKPNIKKFLSSIEDPRRGSMSSRGSTSTSSRFSLSWMRRGSRNT